MPKINKEQKDIRVIYCEGCKDKTKIIHELGKSLAIYEKALELACDQMDEGDVIRFCDEKGTQVNNNEELKNYYLQQAKKEIENGQKTI